MAKLRVMSHNQWRFDNNYPDWEKVGLDCSATTRTKGFAQVYKDLLPDLIGCQEVSFLMADELLRHAKALNLHYSLLWGRETPIIYNPEKFEVVDSAFDLYPEKIDGFDGVFNNYKTKSWTLGVFRVKENGKLFIFVSTHLWWKSSNPNDIYYQHGSEQARVYQLTLLNKVIDQYLQKYNCPVIIAGDFNANYTSSTLKYMIDNGFVHAHGVATDFADNTEGYHECGPSGFNKEYSTRTFEFAIDHLLLKNFDYITVKRFERYSPEYYLPLSDHSPVFIDIEIQ